MAKPKRKKSAKQRAIEPPSGIKASTNGGPSTRRMGGSMKFKVGDKSFAVCYTCQKIQVVALQLRDVRVSAHWTAWDVLVGVCDICNHTISIPQQSTPALRAAIAGVRYERRGFSEQRVAIFVCAVVWTLVALSLLVSCGTEPSIEPGHYDVDVFYVEDTFPNSQEGQWVGAHWIFTEPVENFPWYVQTDPAGMRIPCIESKGRLECTYYNNLDCGAHVSFDMSVDPTQDRHHFVAYGVVAIVGCYLNFKQVAECVGKRTRLSK